MSMFAYDMEDLRRRMGMTQTILESAKQVVEEVKDDVNTLAFQGMNL